MPIQEKGYILNTPFETQAAEDLPGTPGELEAELREIVRARGPRIPRSMLRPVAPGTARSLADKPVLPPWRSGAWDSIHPQARGLREVKELEARLLPLIFRPAGPGEYVIPAGAPPGAYVFESAPASKAEAKEEEMPKKKAEAPKVPDDQQAGAPEAPVQPADGGRYVDPSAAAEGAYKVEGDEFPTGQAGKERDSWGGSAPPNKSAQKEQKKRIDDAASTKVATGESWLAKAVGAGFWLLTAGA